MVITNATYEVRPSTTANSLACSCSANALTQLMYRLHNPNGSPFVWMNFLDYKAVLKNDNVCFEYIVEADNSDPMREVNCCEQFQHNDSNVPENTRRGGNFKGYVSSYRRQEMNCSPCQMGEGDSNLRFWLESRVMLAIRSYAETILLNMIAAINGPIRFIEKNGEPTNLTADKDGVITYDATTLTNFNLAMLEKIFSTMTNVGTSSRYLVILPGKALMAITADIRKNMGGQCCREVGDFLDERVGRVVVYDRFTFFAPTNEGIFFKNSVTTSAVGADGTASSKTGIPGYVIADQGLGMMSKLYHSRLVDEGIVAAVINQWRSRTVLGEYGTRVVNRSVAPLTSLMVAYDQSGYPASIGDVIRVEANFGITRLRPYAAARILFNKTDILAPIVTTAK